MRLHAHNNFQVNKDYTKRCSRNVFNLLIATLFFEAIIVNANITPAASFPCVFSMKPTSFLCYKELLKWSILSWRISSLTMRFAGKILPLGYNKHISLD